MTEQVPSKDQVSEAWDDVNALVAFAYEQGFHELGYDPLNVIDSALAEARRENVRYENAHKILMRENERLRRELYLLQNERDNLADNSHERATRPAHEREGPHCSTCACGIQRYDDKRDLASIIAHLRHGDADGQDDDDAADALERLERDNARLEELLRLAEGLSVPGHTQTIESLRRENERYEEALQQIKQFSEAYPLDVFPAPDWKRSAEVLKAAGLSLDLISAANMRHVITQVQKIVTGVLSETTPPTPPSEGCSCLLDERTGEAIGGPCAGCRAQPPATIPLTWETFWQQVRENNWNPTPPELAQMLMRHEASIPPAVACPGKWPECPRTDCQTQMRCVHGAATPPDDVESRARARFLENHGLTAHDPWDCAPSATKQQYREWARRNAQPPGDVPENIAVGMHTEGTITTGNASGPSGPPPVALSAYCPACGHPMYEHHGSPTPGGIVWCPQK